MLKKTSTNSVDMATEKGRIVWYEPRVDPKVRKRARDRDDDGNSKYPWKLDLIKRMWLFWHHLRVLRGNKSGQRVAYNAESKATLLLIEALFGCPKSHSVRHCEAPKYRVRRNRRTKKTSRYIKCCNKAVCPLRQSLLLPPRAEKLAALLVSRPGIIAHITLGERVVPATELDAAPVLRALAAFRSSFETWWKLLRTVAVGGCWHLEIERGRKGSIGQVVRIHIHCIAEFAEGTHKDGLAMMERAWKSPATGTAESHFDSNCAEPGDARKRVNFARYVTGLRTFEFPVLKLLDGFRLPRFEKGTRFEPKDRKKWNMAGPVYPNQLFLILACHTKPQRGPRSFGTFRGGDG